MNILIDVREYGGTNIASTKIAGKKIQASATSSREAAARAVAKKVLGDYENDEPRLTVVGLNQFAADVLILEGFDTTTKGQCCNCAAEQRIMFKKDRKTFCGGCAFRERQKSEQRGDA